jgi:hypothetical protein
MAEHLLTDEVEVRFGVGSGVLFLLTDVVVVGRLPDWYGVALLLVATAVLAATLDTPRAFLLGLSGWAFATGFAVNTLGALTVAPSDLLRLAVFILVATVAAGWAGGAR